MDEVKELIKKVEDLSTKRQYHEIIILLSDEVLSKYQNPDLYVWRALGHEKIGEIEKALEYADKAIAADSGSSFGYCQRGITLGSKGDYDKAISDYNKAIELKNDYYNAYNARGWAWYNKNEYDKAISDYNRAIELNSGYASAFNNRGIAWKNKGEYDKAISDYEKAIELDENFAWPHSNKGNVLRELGKYDEAIIDYNKAIELDENYAQAYSNRGILWDDKGEYDKAIDDYTKAIELNEDFADAYNNRGVAFFGKGEYDKAIDDYNRAIQLTPNEANVFRNRGNVFFAKGDFQQALEDFEKAILDDKFDFLKYNIKLVKEKLEERKTLEESKAKPDDKIEKTIIENEIVKAINIIKEAARSEVKTVVHYTKVFVGDIYVKNRQTKMHYSNAIYMNDPMEGKVFFEYLNDDKIKEAYDNGEKRTETSVYLGSFLPAEENDGEISHEDELVMWRTYGKDENGKEAAGCSVVLSSDFFKIKAVQKEGTSSKDMSEELLNVVYIKNQKHSKKITNDSKGKIETAIKLLKEQLKKLIKLRNKYKPKDDFYRDIENTVFKQLSTISYLFKSADYDFEHEVRVITYMPRNSDTIKFREVKEPNAPSKRFYIESYNDILPYVKKIYLGPKVENYQQWSLYFDYEIRQRAKEIEAIPTPLYQIKPSDIEIMKSVCKFQ